MDPAVKRDAVVRNLLGSILACDEAKRATNSVGLGWLAIRSNERRPVDGARSGTVAYILCVIGKCVQGHPLGVHEDFPVYRIVAQLHGRRWVDYVPYVVDAMAGRVAGLSVGDPVVKRLVVVRDLLGSIGTLREAKRSDQADWHLQVVQGIDEQGGPVGCTYTVAIAFISCVIGEEVERHLVIANEARA